MYAADTGLLNAHGMGLTANHGPLLENLVFMELRAASGLSAVMWLQQRAWLILVGAEQGQPELIQVCWSPDQKTRRT